MLSSYYLELRTGTSYDEDEYDAAAGRLISMLASVLSSDSHVSALTHAAPRESCHSEIEVSLDENELIAKAVVDVVAQDAVKFDKAKFTKIIKAQAQTEEWKTLKIHKRQVPNVPESFP
jgi:hypothetical protein